LTGAYSYHDARFGHALQEEGGSLFDLYSHQLELSPHQLAAAGLLYAPATGIQGGVQIAYVGRRYLNRPNSVPASGYSTIDAAVSSRRGRYSVHLNARNLTNRRVAVTASEFGDQSIYLLPARQLEAAITMHLE
jgi:outer membrane receptor protein involved in Fe transport